MKEYTFKAYFGDHDKTVEISQMSGAGGTLSLHVLEDRRYIAHIFQVSYGWRWHTPELAQLQSGDIYALIEIIEREFLTQEDGGGDP